MRVIAGGQTHVGQVREGNEDRLSMVLPPRVAHGLNAVLIVADGMGGHQAGEVASSLVVEQLEAWFGERGPAADLRSLDDLPDQLDQAIREANAAVHSAASSSRYKGMGTTVSVAVLAGTQLHLGHVGDSRVYLVRQGRIQQLSDDHSWVAEQVRNGVIRPEDAEDHEDRNVLTRAVGTRSRVKVDTESFDLATGDVVVVCSDGLHGVVGDDEIATVASTYPQPSVAAGQLVARANAAGGPDNVTVVVARVLDLAADDDLADTAQVDAYHRVTKSLPVDPGRWQQGHQDAADADTVRGTIEVVAKVLVVFSAFVGIGVVLGFIWLMIQTGSWWPLGAR